MNKDRMGYIWVWVNTYRYIFSGMNIHLPAILGSLGTRVLCIYIIYIYIYSTFFNNLIFGFV